MSHPTAWCLSGVPAGATPAHTGEQNNGLGLELGSSKAAPWSHSSKEPQAFGQPEPFHGLQTLQSTVKGTQRANVLVGAASVHF